MTRFLRNNGLSLILTAFFAVFLLGQTIAGYHDNNNERQEHGLGRTSLGEYVRTGAYWEAVFENWESEFLQMGAYVLLTVFLYQKGSSESKDPDKKHKVDEDPRAHVKDPKAPSPVRKGGLVLLLYEYSLSILLFLLFLGSFCGHALAGLVAYNDSAAQHHQPLISLGQYLAGARFWFESLQNWQSEFLAVLAIVVLSIWFRQRGSPESKAVASPHSKTGA